MKQAQQVDINWLIDTLEGEWAEAAQQLDQIEQMDADARRDFEAEWPLLASWWERVIEYGRQRPFNAEQQHRIKAVQRTIQRLMPAIEQLVGPEMARLDGIDDPRGMTAAHDD